jgi:hypothetical protein
VTVNPDRLPVPAGFAGPGFVVRAQSLRDAALDLEAVMASKAELRAWSDSDWPSDGFTLAENVADLEGHLADHAADLAYGFSVLTPDGARLQGSLYVDGTAGCLEGRVADAATRARVAALDARLEYWLRTGTPAALEEAFLRGVLAWLRDAWWFRRPAFGSRAAMTARRARYAAVGLVEVAALAAPDGSRALHLHAQPIGATSPVSMS